ncbi:MAG: D-alanyl-D-alanine carboxypeptidase family protein [Pseudomonadota bacterium]
MASLIGRIIRIICIVGTLSLAASPGQAAAFAAHVMDARTGETLYEKNADSRLHPASLTKMMTLYIVFEEISAGRITLDSKVTVSKNAAGQAPSRLGLKPGQKIAVRYLIRAAAVKSANDAATALGEFVAGGSQAAFSKRMNRTAKALGMRNSTFKNPNGLTAEGHLSTARDMSILGRRLFYDFPQFYNIFSRRTADAGMAQVNNTNRRFLDSYEGADGIKTGYTNPAGFNLTASAERGGVRIIATVFGGTSTANRNAKVAELLDLGFSKAPGKVREKKPEAPAYAEPEEMLLAQNDSAAIDAALAEANSGIDVAGAEGGAAKTIRVSGEVRTSLRPKSRPAPAEAAVALAAAEAAPAEGGVMAAALADGVEGALAEAMAAPAAGTLDAQAVAMAAAVPDLTEPDQVEPGTLDAQALALTDVADVVADGATDGVAAGTLEAQAVALADGITDPALAALRPKTRPVTEQIAAVEPVAEPVVSTIAETVMTDAGEVAEDMQIAVAEDMPADLAAGVTDVQSVAGATNAPAAPIALAAATVPAKRKAPNFEAAAAPAVAEQENTPEVVVRASTSGARQFGVNVGAFSSRYEAERALFKIALAESSTLNTGLRKVTESSGKYRANFMGLTEDQADLACRRLRARALECETIG